MKTNGMIVKIKDSHCIVLARDGTYHKVPVSVSKGAGVGAEIEFVPLTWVSYVKPYVKPALMVASILIMILGISLYRLAAPPQTFAYVSLDINPSVELELDKSLKVLNIASLNDDAQKLLADLHLQEASLMTAVNSIMTKAAADGYLKPGQKNYVLSTVSVANGVYNAIDYDAFAQNMKTAVQNSGVEVQLVILTADLNTRNAAKSQGLSTGKFIVYREAIAAGEKVTSEQVRDNSLTNLVTVYKVKLLPNNKKIIVKSIDIPPRGGHSKRDNTEDSDEKDSDENTPENNKQKNDNGKNKEETRENSRDRNKESRKNGDGQNKRDGGHQNDSGTNDDSDKRESENRGGGSQAEQAPPPASTDDSTGEHNRDSGSSDSDNQDRENTRDDDSEKGPGDD